MKSNQIVIIAAMITIGTAIGVAVWYGISDDAVKGNALYAKGENCPAVRSLLDVGDAYNHTQLGRFIQELRDVKIPHTFEPESKNVADEFHRLNAMTEEEVKRVVDELQTATSLNNPSRHTTLFLILLHRVAEERKRLDTVTSAVATATSTIHTIVANAERAYMAGQRSNDELCAMNTMHHHARELHDYLAAVTHSINITTTITKQHYMTAIPWSIHDVYKNYSIEDIYNAYQSHISRTSEALLNMNMDELNSEKGSSGELFWLYIIAGIIGCFLLLFVGIKIYRKIYNLSHLNQAIDIIKKDYTDTFNALVENINTYMKKKDIDLFSSATKLTTCGSYDAIFQQKKNIDIIIYACIAGGGIELVQPIRRNFLSDFEKYSQNSLSDKHKEFILLDLIHILICIDLQEGVHDDMKNAMYISQKNTAYFLFNYFVDSKYRITNYKQNNQYYKFVYDEIYTPYYKYVTLFHFLADIGKSNKDMSRTIHYIPQYTTSHPYLLFYWMITVIDEQLFLYRTPILKILYMTYNTTISVNKQSYMLIIHDLIYMLHNYEPANIEPLYKNGVNMNYDYLVNWYLPNHTYRVLKKLL